MTLGHWAEEASVSTTPTALTANDRCDRCGAQAYMQATMPGGGELLFCAHHANEFGDKLRESGAVIHDETQKLTTV